MQGDGGARLEEEFVVGERRIAAAALAARDPHEGRDRQADAAVAGGDRRAQLERAVREHRGQLGPDEHARERAADALAGELRLRAVGVAVEPAEGAAEREVPRREPQVVDLPGDHHRRGQPDRASIGGQPQRRGAGAAERVAVEPRGLAAAGKAAIGQRHLQRADGDLGGDGDHAAPPMAGVGPMRRAGDRRPREHQGHDPPTHEASDERAARLFSRPARRPRSSPAPCAARRRTTAAAPAGSRRAESACAAHRRACSDRSRRRANRPADPRR